MKHDVMRRPKKPLLGKHWAGAASFVASSIALSCSLEMAVGGTSSASQREFGDCVSRYVVELSGGSGDANTSLAENTAHVSPETIQSTRNALLAKGVPETAVKNLINKILADGAIQDKANALKVLEFIEDKTKLTDPIAQNELRSLMKNLNEYLGDQNSEKASPRAIASVVNEWGGGEQGLVRILEDANRIKEANPKIKGIDAFKKALKAKGIPEEKVEMAEKCMKEFAPGPLADLNLPSPFREVLASALDLAPPYSPLKRGQS